MKMNPRNGPDKVETTPADDEDRFGTPRIGDQAEQGGIGREPVTGIEDHSKRAAPMESDHDRVERARQRADQERTAALAAASREAKRAHEALSRAHDDLAAELTRSASQRSKEHDD